MVTPFRRSATCLLASGALMWACSFIPKEIPLTEVKTVDQPRVTLSITTLGSKDTLYLFEPATLTYDLSGNGHIFYNVTITYDDETLSTSAPPSGSISIDNSRLTTGLHRLRIEFATNSGSGSLADKAGAEAFTVWRDVIIIIDVDPPPVLTPLLTNEGGLLKLSWPAYRKNSFVRYVLTVQDWLHPRQTLVITNPLDTTYVNNTFFGGQELMYWFEVVNKIGSATCPTQIVYPRYNLSGTYRTADSTVTLSWPAIEYPGAFSKTVILENNLVLGEYTGYNATSITFRPDHVVFGYPLNYSATIYGKDGTLVYASGSLNLPNPIVSPIAQFLSTYYYQAAHGPYLGLFGNSLVQFSSQLQITHSWGPVSGPFAILPQGDYYYTTDGQNTIFQNNLIDQSVTPIDVLRVSTGGIMFINGMSHASGDGKVVIRYRGHDISGSFLVNHVSIVDLSTRQNIFHVESTGSLGAPAMSGNGRYFFYGNQVYEITGTTKTLLYTIPPTLSPISFRPDNEDELFAASGEFVSILESSTGNVLRNISAPEPGYIYRGYDVPSLHLLFLKQNSFHQYAVQVETGAITRIDAYSGPNSYVGLVYGYVYNQNGEYFKAIEP